MAESREVCCSSPAAVPPSPESCSGSLTRAPSTGSPRASPSVRRSSPQPTARRPRRQWPPRSWNDACAVRHRSDSLLGWKPGPRARARKFGMVTALRRNRRSVPVGMEIRKAFLTSARPSLILFGRNLGFFPCRRDGFYVVLPYQIIQGHEIFRLDLAPSGQLCLQSPV